MTVSALALITLKSSINWKGLWRIARDFVETSKVFFQDYIVEPARRIYRTVRYRDERLRLVGVRSLEADLEVH